MQINKEKYFYIDFIYKIFGLVLKIEEVMEFIQSIETGHRK